MVFKAFLLRKLLLLFLKNLTTKIFQYQLSHLIFAEFDFLPNELRLLSPPPSYFAKALTLDFFRSLPPKLFTNSFPFPCLP